MSRRENCRWHDFGAPDDLAEALAGRVASELRRAIAARGHALLAVSGGKTPVRFFRALAGQALDWTNVAVTLVDERFVPPSSERSNERLVRRHLLQDHAAAAEFLGLFRQAETVEEAALAASEGLAGLPLPIDIVVLGMGTDGHTASFFPDAANLQALLDPASSEMVLPVHAESAGEPRLTLALARLIEARSVLLHIEGNEKRRVLETALNDGAGMPVTALFDHAKAPVQVYWTPDQEKQT